ncbi:hypothetical protein O9929_19270 [Vibrio lentus]|nr:hypothetical protein [Vibrio lentus]
MKPLGSHLKDLDLYSTVYTIPCVAVIALIINASLIIYMISLLKPLLDEGFGNVESDFYACLIIIFAMIIRGEWLSEQPIA